MVESTQQVLSLKSQTLKSLLKTVNQQPISHKTKIKQLLVENFLLIDRAIQLDKCFSELAVVAALDEQQLPQQTLQLMRKGIPGKLLAASGLVGVVDVELITLIKQVSLLFANYSAIADLYLHMPSIIQPEFIEYLSRMLCCDNNDNECQTHCLQLLCDPDDVALQEKTTELKNSYKTNINKECRAIAKVGGFIFLIALCSAYAIIETDDEAFGVSVIKSCIKSCDRLLLWPMAQHWKEQRLAYCNRVQWPARIRYALFHLAMIITIEMLWSPSYARNIAQNVPSNDIFFICPISVLLAGHIDDLMVALLNLAKNYSLYARLSETIDFLVKISNGSKQNTAIIADHIEQDDSEIDLEASRGATKLKIT
jgi:hypothetical protein